MRRSPWATLAVLALAQFMVVLDVTIVNVALPDIQQDLSFTPDNLQWVISAYTLVFGGFLLLGGRAADLLGRRRLFIGGLVLFAVASLAGDVRGGGPRGRPARADARRDRDAAGAPGHAERPDAAGARQGRRPARRQRR